MAVNSLPQSEREEDQRLGWEGNLGLVVKHLSVSLKDKPPSQLRRPFAGGASAAVS